MIDEYISAITQIANHDRIKKYIEPNIFRHQDIQEWQVKRILYAEGLLIDELRKDIGGTIPEVDVSVKRSIHGNP